MAKGGRRAGSGQKPTPTALRQIQGGRKGGRKAGTADQEIPAAVPARPPWLRAEAVGEWDHLVKMLEPLRVLTRLESRSLALVAEALADYHTAKSDSGRDRAWRRAFSGLAEFGLTPSSRTKLATRGASAPREKTPIERFIEEGGS